METQDGKKLIDEIRQNAVEDSQAIIEKFVEMQQESQEKFLSEIELLLTNCNAKNLEVYNALSNKIDVACDNIEKNLNSRIEQNNYNLDDKMEKNIRSLRTEILRHYRRC